MIEIPHANTITDQLDTVRGGQLGYRYPPVIPVGANERRQVVCIGTGVFQQCVVLEPKRPPAQDHGSPAPTKP